MSSSLWRKWLSRKHKLTRRGGRLTPLRKTISARPRLESLEDRLVPATFTPTTFADVAISSVAAVDAAGEITDQGNAITLRSATIAANAATGANTITLNAGTYTLSIPGDASDQSSTGSFNPMIGDLDISDSGLTIQGAGSGNTTIQQTTGADRILTANISGDSSFLFTLTGVTVTGGVDSSTGGGGGALYTGSSGGTTTISNCLFVNNNETGGAGNGNGGGAIFHAGGDLTITNCTFGGTGASDPNTSNEEAGAIRYEAGDYVNNFSPATLTITGSNFIDNSETGYGGGAVVISNVNNLTSAMANITACTFQGNTTPFYGGAIEMDGGSLMVSTSTFAFNAAGLGGGAIRSFQNTVSTHVAPVTSVSFSRFVNNSAAHGQVLDSGCTGSFTANDNWWASNAGPEADDTTVEAGASAITVSNELQFNVSASPSTIAGGVGGTSTVTADFTKDSMNNTITAANLAALVGLPVSFGATLGALTGAQATIQRNGQATALFTATATGAGTATATVDGVAATTNITIPSAATLTTVVIDANTAPIKSLTVSGNLVTVTTLGNTTFAAGQPVLIFGASVAADNGSFVVQTGSANSNTFTYIDINVGLANATGGTATVNGGNGNLGSGAVGSSQRSMVDSIMYTFSAPVAAPTVIVSVYAGKTGTVPTVNLSSTDGGTTWVVTFTGAGVTGNSIADGVYNVSLSAGAINRTDTFYRLFGDINGDKQVNSLVDFTQFKKAQGSSNGAAAYVAVFDYNADGQINSLIDFAQFKLRQGKSFSGFIATI